MNYTTMLYHEANYKYPYIPGEDASHTQDNIFCVADGVTLDITSRGDYPQPSDSAIVADIAARELLQLVANGIDFETAFAKANQRIASFNNNSALFANRETNGFSFGATEVAVAKIYSNTLMYAFLDDCFVQVFSKELHPKISIIPHVENSSSYFNPNYDWKTSEGKKVWRKDIRNHSITTPTGEKIGYGTLDGFQGYETYVQKGTVYLESGDIIIVGTDGFIQPLADNNFLALIQTANVTLTRYEAISAYMRQTEVHKEKTAYITYVA